MAQGLEPNSESHQDDKAEAERLVELDRFIKRSERALQEVAKKIGAPEAELRQYLQNQRDYQTTRDIRWTRIVSRLFDHGQTWAQIKSVPPDEAEEMWLDTHPREAPFHDILLVRRTVDEDDDGETPKPKQFRYHRFQAIKEGPGRGGFQGPDGAQLDEVGVTEDGYRAVINLATTAPGTSAERGPILSALPLNPDPAASSSCTCYLLNPSNLNYATAWTAEEWSDQPGDEGEPLAPGEDVFNLLIATPAGKVYYLEKKKATALAKPIDDEIVFREINLSDEVEVWSQLRSGCVVGRAVYTKSPAQEPQKKVTPLVNIHSLLPAPPPHPSKN
jgi:hypothetical protein